MVDFVLMVYSGEQRSAALRATDSDRDGAVNLLNDALSVGRLTADEHGERLEAALTAKTLDQLAALTADLGPSTVTDSSRSRLPQWIALIAAASVLVILLVTLLGRNSQREPALTSGAATTAGSTNNSVCEMQRFFRFNPAVVRRASCGHANNHASIRGLDNSHPALRGIEQLCFGNTAALHLPGRSFFYPRAVAIRV